MNYQTFGQLVRQRRNWLGLTQKELGKQACCAEITIRKIEGDVRRPSIQLTYLLAEALEIPDSERAVFVRQARRQLEALPLPHLSEPANN